MPPLLLLHDPSPPFETRRTVRLLRERLDGVESMDIRPHRWREFRAAASPRGCDNVVVHAFGGRAMAAAILFAKGEIFYTAERFPRRSDVAWLRAALRYRAIRIVCQSDAERRAWVTGGVPIDRCVIIRPGVSLAMSVDIRLAARARLGFSEADRVIFTPVPPLGEGRTMAVWTSCLANIQNAAIKMAVWTETRRDTLESLRARLLVPSSVQILEDDAPDAGFAAADVVLLPPSDFVPPTLVAMAMACGRPIVSATTAAVCEMIEDRHTALLAGGRTPKPLAERVADAFTDTNLSRQVGDRARAEVYEYFLLSRMMDDYRAVYLKSAVDPHRLESAIA